MAKQHRRAASVEKETRTAEKGATVVNPIQVQKFLKGMDYPVEKNEVLRHAKDNGADKLVMDTLDRIPDRTYHGPNAISKAIGAEE